jgi:23S rRNA (guanine1835-N2)-methyltransferase
METTLEVPQGVFELTRNITRKPEALRAWDAADEYLLHYLTEEQLLVEGVQILILNDNFGALAVALQRYSPVAISDSYLSQQVTRSNLISNDLTLENVQMHSIMEFTQASFDLVLIKVPKTLALLEYELIMLSENITPSTRVILAGMLKVLPRSVWALCERILGPTTTSLAKKKSRLIFISPDKDKELTENPYPVCYQLENTKYKICNHANVFSRDSLDIGTRFFLQHIPSNASAKCIIDLGCGNGVVGLIAAQINQQSKLCFVDESFMALASAKQNFLAAFSDSREADFYAADGLADIASSSADLILCNPPFHQQQTVGDHIAQQMFKQSLRVLQKGGELRVIGNRHLGYHVSLKRVFGNVEQLATNAKFVILKSIKT